MKSFLSDRPRIDAPSASRALAATPSPFTFETKAAAACANGGAPSRVECARDGDRVTRIIVHCACGERIEIDCLYAEGA